MVQPGILALQGGFAAHGAILEKLDYPYHLVRTPEELDSVGCLIIPGGESTVMVRLLKRFRLWEPLQDRIRNGFPLFGTCAGMILLSSGVDGSEQPTLSAMDFIVSRNAYGRQKESFEVNLSWMEETFSALFIRAPRISSTEKSVEVLLRNGNTPVLVRQGNCLAASFHPELTGFAGIHRFFLKEIVKENKF